MVEEKIKELGFELPEVAKPLAAYIPAIQIGDLVYTSGQVPIEKGELKYSGKIGFDLTVEEGQIEAFESGCLQSPVPVCPGSGARHRALRR